MFALGPSVAQSLENAFGSYETRNLEHLYMYPPFTLPLFVFVCTVVLARNAIEQNTALERSTQRTGQSSKNKTWQTTCGRQAGITIIYAAVEKADKRTHANK